MNYKTHGKELLKDKAVRAEYEKLLPEYQLAKSIIQQRIKKKMTQSDVAKKTGMPPQCRTFRRTSTKLLGNL